MDDRTNTLIITDLRDRRPDQRLIDALDEQTPQVVIEARIVETDREFERDLGIKWGVHGKADQSMARRRTAVPAPRLARYV